MSEGAGNEHALGSNNWQTASLPLKTRRLPCTHWLQRLFLIPTTPATRSSSWGTSGRLGRAESSSAVSILIRIFRTHYEINKDDIHHAQKADPAAEEQPTNIYIKSTAKLLLVQTVEASFLTGQITSSYPVGSPAEQPWYLITTYICQIIFCGGLPNTHGCSPGGVLITFGCGPGGILHTNRCKIGAVPPTHGGVTGPGGGSEAGAQHGHHTCPPGGTPHTNHGCRQVEPQIRTTVTA